VTALAILDLIALLAIVAYLLWLRRPKGPPPERFFLRTGEGLYLTPQGLRRGAIGKDRKVLAPPHDALAWPSHAAAQEEMKTYYELNSISVSTFSRVSLYVEKEGDPR
jgi:hypothetical protein